MDRRSFLSSSIGGIVLLSGCSGDSNEPRSGESQAANSETTPTASSTPSDAPNDTQTEAESAPTNLSIKLGEVFGKKDLKAVVEDITRKKELAQDTAGRNNEFAVISLAVKNVSSKYDYNIDGFPPVFTATLKDDESYTYEEELISPDTPFVSGVISPGEVMRGDKVYTVPTDASGLSMQFDFSNNSIIGVNQATVDLTEQAEQPEKLDQDLAIDLHTVGETVSLDGLGLTINDFELVRENNDQELIADITFANNTNGEIPNTHLQEFWCKNGEGQYMKKDFFFSSSRNYATDSPLSDGETRRGEVAFTIEPQDPQNIYCTYEFSEHVDGHKAFWKLK